MSSELSVSEERGNEICRGAHLRLVLPSFLVSVGVGRVVSLSHRYLFRPFFLPFPDRLPVLLPLLPSGFDGLPHFLLLDRCTPRLPLIVPYPSFE